MSRFPIPDERLAELAFGEPPTEEERVLLEADPALADELARIEDSLAVTLPPVPPPPPLRQRLMADTADPWWRALEAVTRLVDLSVDGVKAAFRRAREEAWSPWEAMGVDLFHFDGGPITTGADVGLVRAPANHLFLEHRHKGPEHIVVLEGSMHTGGRWLRAGDTDMMGTNSVHEWVSGPDGVVFAVVIFEGVEIPGLSP